MHHQTNYFFQTADKAAREPFLQDFPKSSSSTDQKYTKSTMDLL